MTIEQVLVQSSYLGADGGDDQAQVGVSVTHQTSQAVWDLPRWLVEQLSSEVTRERLGEWYTLRQLQLISNIANFVNHCEWAKVSERELFGRPSS